jgi:hypothetical protein
MLDFLAWLENTEFASWLRESGSIWAYPAVLTLHTLGLGVLVGASAVIDLRLLGAASHIPIAPLRRLFPIMWAGFWVNAISGALLFVTDATTKGTTTVFMSKLGIIVLAVIVLTTIKRSAFGHNPVSSNPPMSVKALAAASLALWLAAIITGRYMAYV